MALVRGGQAANQARPRLRRGAAGMDARSAGKNKAVVKIAVCMSKRKKARRLATGLHLQGLHLSLSDGKDGTGSSMPQCKNW